jgi:hypothetical protein
LYHKYIHNPALALEEHFTDMVLASSGGHRVLADVLIHYLQGQICRAWSTAKGYSFEVPIAITDSASPPVNDGLKGLFRGMGDVRKGEQVDDEDQQGTGRREMIPLPDSRSPDMVSAVPPYLLSTRAVVAGGTDGFKFREVKPYCVSANDLINPLPSTLFLGSGWHVNRPKVAYLESQTPAGSYFWYATYPKSKLRVPVKIESGDVAVWYLTQRLDLVNSPQSAVKCWVDNNIPGAVTIESGANGDPTPTSVSLSSPLHLFHVLRRQF